MPETTTNPIPVQVPSQQPVTAVAAPPSPPVLPTPRIPNDIAPELLTDAMKAELESQRKSQTQAVLPSPSPQQGVPSPPPAAVPTPAKHEPYLVRMASDLGMSREEIDELSPESLRATVSFYARKLREVAFSNTAPVPPAPPPAPPAEPPLIPEYIEASDEDLDERGNPVSVQKKYRAKDIAPPILKLLEEQEKKIRELTKFKNEFEKTSTKTQEEAAARSVEARLDAFFSAQPHLFGTGSSTGLTEAAHYTRRQAVFAIFSTLPKEQRTTFEGDLARIAAMLYGSAQPVATAATQYAAPAPVQPKRPTPPKDPVTGLFRAMTPQEMEEYQAALAAWNQGAVAIPTQQSASEEPLGEAKAKRAINERFAQIQAQRTEPSSNGAFVP